MMSDFINQQYSVSRGGENVKEGTRKSRTASILTGTFFSISILVAVGLIAFTIVFFYSAVDGSSMMATLNAAYTPQNPISDSVIVNRYATPKRGEIIVVKYYRGSGKNTDSLGTYDLFIKRLIAYEGESVYFERYPEYGVEGGWKYKIEIDGVTLSEPYLDPYWGQNITYGSVWSYLQNPQNCPYKQFVSWVERSGGGRYEIVIPEGYIFFMGDNRGGSGSSADLDLKSMDCTVFGPQPVSNYVGTVSEIVYNYENVAQFLWRKLKYYITFQWI